MAKILFTNNATTTLLGGVDLEATTFTVSPGTGVLFPDINVGKDEYFYCTLISKSGNFEIVKVTSKVDDRFTCVRGVENTEPRNFAQGDIVELRLTAGGLNWIADRLASIETEFGFTEDGFNPSDQFVISIVNHPKFKHAPSHGTTGTDIVTPVSIGGANGDAEGNAINANQWNGSAQFRSSSAPTSSAGKVNDIWFQWIA